MQDDKLQGIGGARQKERRMAERGSTEGKREEVVILRVQESPLGSSRPECMTAMMCCDLLPRRVSPDRAELS